MSYTSLTQAKGADPKGWQEKYGTKVAAVDSLQDRLELAKEASTANRVAEIEDRMSAYIKGDFEGSVTGKWKALGSRGEGIVSYAGKDYSTKPIGFVSAPEGTEVELSFANGTYYSKF